MAPSAKGIVDGYPREVWVNEAREEVIESYTITSMAHGTPLAIGGADHECGAPGPFLLEVGISSSYHIAKFFGLTAVNPRPVTLTGSNTGAVAKPLPGTRLSQPRGLKAGVGSIGCEA